MAKKKTWKVTMWAKYHRDGLEETSEVFSTTYSGEKGAKLEKKVLWLITAHLIMLDDERFGGPGTPISTSIEIEYVK
jgi:hypothetical protein